MVTEAPRQDSSPDPHADALQAGIPVPAPRESRSWRWSVLIGLLILAAIATVPLQNDRAALNLWTTVVMFCVLAQSWNLIGGFVGYAAFGNVAFFGIGAYVVALIVQRG